MALNSLEIKDSIHQMVEESRAIINTCKEEKRALNEEEKAKIDELKGNINLRKQELQDLEKKLEEEERNKNNKNIQTKSMERRFLIEAIKQAKENIQDGVTFNAETRTISVNGVGGVHDDIVEVEVKGLFEGLTEKSIFSSLGCQFYSGMPMGDIKVSKIDMGDATWEDENAEAKSPAVSFSGITLRPKRITAYCDISNMLIAQDTLSAEAKIREMIQKKVLLKLEKSIFSDTEGTATVPQGIFYDKEFTLANDFGKICDLEASMEEESVYGDKKYVLSPRAKSALRSTVKGNANVGMILEGGEIDGTPAYDTNILSKNGFDKEFVVGDWQNLVIASWNDIRLLVDPYTQATKDITRIVVNAYFDFGVLEPKAFAFGTIDE